MGDFDYGYERGWWGDDGIPNWIDNDEPEQHVAKPLEGKKEEPTLPETEKTKPKIALVGVGTAGIKTANMISGDSLYEDIKTISVSAIEHETRGSDADVKIVLYKGEPFSYHQPYPPSRARDAALENYNEIKEALMQ